MAMRYQLSVPSKTFLLGEYVALKSGPALVMTTEKYFQLNAVSSVHGAMTDLDVATGIHPDSPAGKLLQTALAFYRNYSLEFVDPYQRLGGFGASTAEFIMVYALKQYVENKPIDVFAALAAYQKFAWNGQGIPPSGADLVAQFQGGICYYYKNEKECKVFAWPFPDLAYCLIHTGNKLNTHLHLNQLRDFDVAGLSKIVMMGLESILQNDAQLFVAAIRDYAQALQAENLVAKETQVLLNAISSCPHIQAAKGCGALGADVILTVYDHSKQSQVMAWMQSRQLNVMAYGNHVAEGLSIGVL